MPRIHFCGEAIMPTSVGMEHDSDNNFYAYAHVDTAFATNS